VSKRGLPAGLSMRHDAHYVEELAQHRPTPVGRLIAIDKIDPNPDQPRVEIGDLTELTASISDKGVLEPLLVKPSRLTSRWMIIAGERRWRAAREAGLLEVPCIEMDVDDNAVAEIALIENLQRKDLTIWEEADGLLSLCNRFGYTHEDVAQKMGKSRSTITESLSIAALPEIIREPCRKAGITTKSLLLQIVRQPDEESMLRMVEEVTSRGLTRDEARATRRAQVGGNQKEAVSSPYTFRYVSPAKEFRLEVRFRQAIVDQSDVATALRMAADSIDEEDDGFDDETN
jgi:ParB family transcriptional regulator, chromosome partitioning protein